MSNLVLETRQFDLPDSRWLRVRINSIDPMIEDNILTGRVAINYNDKMNAEADLVAYFINNEPEDVSLIWGDKKFELSKKGMAILGDELEVYQRYNRLLAKVKNAAIIDDPSSYRRLDLQITPEEMAESEKELAEEKAKEEAEGKKPEPEVEKKHRVKKVKEPDEGDEDVTEPKMVGGKPIVENQESAKLITDAKAGDNRAYTDLYDQYKPIMFKELHNVKEMYRNEYGAVIDDAFDKGVKSYMLDSGVKFITYLIRIFRNARFNFLRDKSRQEKRELSVPISETTDIPGVAIEAPVLGEDVSELKEDLEELLEAANVGDNAIKIYHLRAGIEDLSIRIKDKYDKVTTQAIAEELGISNGRVSQIMDDAFEKIMSLPVTKQFLKKYNIKPEELSRDIRGFEGSFEKMPEVPTFKGGPVPSVEEGPEIGTLLSPRDISNEIRRSRFMDFIKVALLFGDPIPERKIVLSVKKVKSRKVIAMDINEIYTAISGVGFAVQRVKDELPTELSHLDMKLHWMLQSINTMKIDIKNLVESEDVPVTGMKTILIPREKVELVKSAMRKLGEEYDPETLWPDLYEPQEELPEFGPDISREFKKLNSILGKLIDYDNALADIIEKFEGYNQPFSTTTVDLITEVRVNLHSAIGQLHQIFSWISGG
jgi:RNA polymerase sigma factor (sigma-70 family)